MDNQGKRKVATAFASAFAESLGEVLASATGVLWPLEVLSQPNTPTPKGTPINFRVSVDGALSGEYYVEFYEPQVVELVSRILKQPVAKFTDEHAEILVKVLASATDKLAASPSGEFGQLRFRVERVAGLAFGGMFVVPLAVLNENSDMQVLLYFGGQMLDMLSMSGQSSSEGESDKSAVPSHNLKLVMDVELNVSLRFGQRQLPLREVLDLGSGSVIELDRMADEPVELYLDGKLIARGEAVVVDGNYGLRVTEIPQPVASYLTN
jgi:flagellar motor switch protein FliN/FliY